jgi:hypothetical protein
MGKLSDWKKAKMGQLPGDWNRWVKIRMLEEEGPVYVNYANFTIPKNGVKAFRREQKLRAKIKFKSRTRREINAGMDEYEEDK